ncbi:MAG: hypothetical protein Ct9H90mP2_05560 [Dehalococcoidia bacterium]|nr:MAG: hypothetical protein Ct9H90mP2_05560 [Dehalococcoidia bacterium]
MGLENEITINKNGKLDIPSGPGLGLNIDEEWIKFHTISTLD